MRRRLKVCAAALVLLIGATVAADRIWAPPLARYEDRSRVVLDRAGAPLRMFMSGDDKWRLRTTPADVDPLYLAMLKAFEDKRFDSHWGVDPLAVGRAVLQAAAAGRPISGASTLTMQTARLLEPRSRTLLGKLAQMARAAQLERRYAKAEILSIYLTLAPFGGPVEGVRAAALKLFQREPGLLTPAEAALLVALPQSPNARRPDKHPEAARAARARVLDRAVGAGVLTAEAAARAKAAPLPSGFGPTPFLAPHLAGELHRAAPDDRDVRATIDAALQAKTERRLKAALADLPAPTTAAALIVDARTAEVRAIVGGPDYFDRDRAGMIDMTQATRSPGSALKPFVYGLAFDRLLATPETVIGDRPFREGGYAPTNFDGGYAGDVTAGEALIRSLNIPAVKMLRRLGADRFDAAMASAGVALTFDREGGDTGLALALGGVGLSLRDLARAYVALHGDGRAPDRLILTAGAVAEWKPLLQAEAAGAVRRILADVAPPAGHATTGGDAPRIAYKTGTSYGFRDALAAGLVGDHVVAVWVGRPDGASCAGCVGVAAAAPILFDLARLLPEGPPDAALAMRRPTPTHLLRFDRPTPGRAPHGHALAVRFPVDGAEVRLGRSGAAPLRATGGAAPYRWLVDGAPVGGVQGAAPFAWRPAGPGFHDILVLDADGASARAQVFVAAGR